jgi:hypothetical protein
MGEREVPLDAPYDTILDGQIAAAARDGSEVSKIMLIFALREATGLGLKEAKDAVDEYGQRKAPRSPWLYGL